jgi:alpha-glucoside transport system permease protein
MSLIPLLLLFTGGAHIGSVTIFPALGLAGDFAGIWLPHTMFALPLAIYLLHNFIASLPRDLMEAAHVDGANHFKVFRMIVLPLSIPGIAAIAIFQFLWVWHPLLVSMALVTHSYLLVHLSPLLCHSSCSSHCSAISCADYLQVQLNS